MRGVGRALAALSGTLTAIFVAAPAHADSVRGHEWFLPTLNVTHAHRYSTGTGIVVAIIDTGVDATHPDLLGRVLRGIDLSDPTNPDGKGTGWDDQDGHGTAIAGVIAGHGHGPSRSDGILGIAPGAKILPIRNGVGASLDEESAVTGVYWAINHGASVICLAEAGPVDDPDLSSAIEAAESKDIVVVAGAGNTPAQGLQYPAAYPGVLAVGGTDQHGKHAAISVVQNYISIAAPATDIYSTYLNHGYASGDGTSAATAIVAGAAALVRSRFPHLSAAEVIHRLTATATDEGPPGRDDEYGYGELNLVAALTANVPPLRSSPSPSSADTPAPSSDPATSIPPLAQVADASGGVPYLPVAVGVIGVLLVLGVWLVLRRKARSP